MGLIDSIKTMKDLLRVNEDVKVIGKSNFYRVHQMNRLIFIEPFKSHV
jgi:hypothetical protein